MKIPIGDPRDLLNQNEQRKMIYLIFIIIISKQFYSNFLILIHHFLYTNMPHSY